jgi:hypothetical protein
LINRSCQMKRIRTVEIDIPISENPP